MMPRRQWTDRMALELNLSRRRIQECRAAGAPDQDDAAPADAWPAFLASWHLWIRVHRPRLYRMAVAGAALETTTPPASAPAGAEHPAPPGGQGADAALSEDEARRRAAQSAAEAARLKAEGERLRNEKVRLELGTFKRTWIKRELALSGFQSVVGILRETIKDFVVRAAAEFPPEDRTRVRALLDPVANALIETARGRIRTEWSATAGPEPEPEQG